MHQIVLNLEGENIKIIGASLGALTLLTAVIRLLIMPRYDKRRLDDYIQRYHPAWRSVNVRRKLFGPGWMGLSRIYLVTYRINANKRKTRFFKVGLFSGIYETMEWPMEELDETIFKRRATEARRRRSTAKASEEIARTS